MNRFTKKGWLLLFLGLAGMAVYLGIHLHQLVRKPAVTYDTSFYVHPGYTIDSIAHNLAQKKIIDKPGSFLWLADKMQFTKAKTGHYYLTRDASLHTLIQQLRAGNQTPVNITFHNILTIAQFCGDVSRQLALDSARLSDEIYHGSLITSGQFNQQNLLCAFIPNTYEFYWNVSVSQFIDRMLREYHIFWNTKRREQATSLGLTPTEVGILASIVDAETAKEDERATIAGVYLNRLRRNMRLQADPTIRFIMQDTIRRVLYKDLKIESPYNTYLHHGLPPGPIRMPSPQSIEAVLRPEKHHYLYFCAREDLSGYHRFAKTLQQHNINRRKYQAAINQLKIFR